MRRMGGNTCYSKSNCQTYSNPNKGFRIPKEVTGKISARRNHVINDNGRKGFDILLSFPLAFPIM